MVRESLRLCHSPWIPIPSHIPILSKFLWGGGGSITQVTIFPPKKTDATGIRLTPWLKFGVIAVRGKRGRVIVHHYFLKKIAHFGETWTPKKIVIFWRKLPLRLDSDSKEKICAHVQRSFEFPIPFPFPQSSQKRESVIPRFPFPQDWREWPSLTSIIELWTFKNVTPSGIGCNNEFLVILWYWRSRRAATSTCYWSTALHSWPSACQPLLSFTAPRLNPIWCRNQVRLPQKRHNFRSLWTLGSTLDSCGQTSKPRPRDSGCHDHDLGCTQSPGLLPGQVSFHQIRKFPKDPVRKLDGLFVWSWLKDSNFSLEYRLQRWNTDQGVLQNRLM